jgi:hypothetical protein
VEEHWSNAAMDNTEWGESITPSLDDDMSLGDALFKQASNTTSIHWEDDNFLA